MQYFNVKNGNFSFVNEQKDPNKKIEDLQFENANLFLDSVVKDLKIDALEQENANLILSGIQKEMRLEALEESDAQLLLELIGKGVL